MRQIGKILRRYNEMIVRCLFAFAILEKDEQDAVLEVFDRRRTMFKSPAHVTAMMLDPKFRERTMSDDDEMQHGLKLALIQFGYPEHSDQHNEVLTAIDKFHSRELSFDDVAVDRGTRSYTHPAYFWESKEKRFLHTTFFAGRILRMWATASPCERAWSRWSFIHFKSRNRLEVARAEKLMRCHWNLWLLDRQPMSDDALNDRPHPYGSWVHYWQQVEEEVPTDQQLVSDRGALVTVTQEELMHARERMRAVSCMEATRRLWESDRRRCRGGGRGGGCRGGRRGGRGRGRRGGPDGRRSVASHGRTTDELLRKPQQGWDKEDFLYKSSSIGGVPATDTTDETQQPVVGSSPTAQCDRATVLPTVAFYVSGSSTGGLDKQGVRIVGRPSALSMETQSTGSVDGARHTAMTEFEDQHGSVLSTKTSDVHATRAAKASLSRPRKKASARKASRSSSHMRSHIGRSSVVHLENGEIAPGDDALDVRGRAATTTDSVAREGAGDAVAGQKRRGSVLIVHDDSTDVAQERPQALMMRGTPIIILKYGRRTEMMEEGDE
ncbi:hypothetical protein CBR_g28713 [Chara braunii]|uniref:HAT C-terminal dimerisation domain-containing protein n=1 Tax=Chara braunii TaxID=69332 RepID=A0A388L9L1_CHABU|nr:hypothetical protein CBR_g28713 [Chara braunii]|eukprot:GBG79000.1 hypothetical protein CBR_g28713 [Chara braunii]